MFLTKRPRRNRASQAIRDLVKETVLTPNDFVLPLFVVGGKAEKQRIASLPEVFRYSSDLIIEEVKKAHLLGIKAVALFPAIEASLKDAYAKESKNKNGLIPQTIKKIKDTVPEVLVITDVAMDPYSSDGHDGVVKNGLIVNDESLSILAEMALVQAEAGADIIAPSDMMDGRVGFIRKSLDENGYSETSILSYAAKYASSFYGPFRDALDSAPKFGDKKTYQMDPANSKEALREMHLDIQEGADIVMVKPALSYLDIILKIKENSEVPVAAFHVSGEYAMIKAAAEKGWLDEKLAMMECLLSIKRAGADILFSYFALQAAQILEAKKE